MKLYRFLLCCLLVFSVALTPLLTACSAGLAAEKEPISETADSEGTADFEASSETKETEENVKTEDKKKEKDPSKDDEMNLIFIGNSYCYYWIDELWGLMNAAGYEKLTVCNVYYSGCSLQQHVDWLMNRESNYDFIIYTEKGRVEKEKTGLKACLDFADWDVVSILQSGSLLYGKGEEALRNSIQKDLGTLLSYVKKFHPNAKYYWQQSWVHGIGNDCKDLADQARLTDINRRVAIDTCASYGMTRIPLGDAWELVRHDPLIREGGKTLTTRIFLGKPDHDDLSHDGDVGGGQFLNACVAFEVITGKSCLENSFVPHYEFEGQDLSLSEEKITLLKNSAHQAVAGVYGEDYAK